MTSLVWESFLLKERGHRDALYFSLEKKEESGGRETMAFTGAMAHVQGNMPRERQCVASWAARDDLSCPRVAQTMAVKMPDCHGAFQLFMDWPDC